MSSSVCLDDHDDGGGDRKVLRGFCSRCRKIWTLKERQGLCQWCGKPASCQTTRTHALRSFKSSGSRRRTQALPHSNGYDHLEGEWLTYYKVASRFSHKAKAQDKDDLLHDIMVRLADVEHKNGHKPFTEALMYRIASRTVCDYWRTYYEITNGLDCKHCTGEQRQKCREHDSYSQCPKAIKLEYLSKPIMDSEGHMTELGQLIADDQAIDLDAWVDAKTFLLGCPQRLIAIAHKMSTGEALANAEMKYLCKWRKREQKS